MPTDADPPFELRLRQLREARGLSYRELARRAYCSHTQIWEAEKGRKRLSPQLVACIDAALGADGELVDLLSRSSRHGREPDSHELDGQELDDDELAAVDLARRVEASNVGTHTLARLAAAVDELATAYASTPPADLLARTRKHLRYVTSLLTPAPPLPSTAGSWWLAAGCPCSPPPSTSTCTGGPLARHTWQPMAGYFVAGHRQVEDVWLLWRAKQANFDTWCGFDVSYLYAGGVTATIDAVRSSTHPDRGALLERLLDDDGAPHVSDAEVEEYLEGAGEQFPADPELDGQLRWVERARRLGDLETARRLLTGWAEEQPGDASTLRTMQYELADLGDFGAAAAVQEQVVALIEDPFDKASGLMRLTELRRLAGEPAGAWEALSECERVLQGVDEWQEVGLGRHFVQEHFQLVVVMPDSEAARTVLAAGHRHAAAVPRLPFVALAAAVEAAERVGDTDLRDSYQILRDEERRRIDAELDQLRH